MLVLAHQLTKAKGLGFRRKVQWWWGTGSGHGEAMIRAWTTKGAIRKAKRLAKAQKPHADIVGVCVL